MAHFCHIGTSCCRSIHFYLMMDKRWGGLNPFPVPLAKNEGMSFSRNSGVYTNIFCFTRYSWRRLLNLTNCCIFKIWLPQSSMILYQKCFGITRIWRYLSYGRWLTVASKPPRKLYASASNSTAKLNSLVRIVLHNCPIVVSNQTETYN